MASLRTHAEMLAACQIPTATLKKMTTQAVIQAILDHPLISLMIYLDGYQSSWDKVFSGNNACAELAKRNDSGKLLLERLIAVNPLSLQHFIKDIELEFLFSQYLEHPDDMRTIVEVSLRNYELRQRSLEYGNTFHFLRDVTLILIGRAMLAAKYAPFVNAVNENQSLQLYIGGSASYLYRDGGLRYVPIQPIIIDFAINFINEK